MFRFTIREMVLLTLIVAMSLGSYMNWSAMAKQSATLGEENAYLRRVEAEAIEWSRAAKEQMLRANHVSRQLNDKQWLTRMCPDCGASVAFKATEQHPWTPPAGSIWRRPSLIDPFNGPPDLD